MFKAEAYALVKADPHCGETALEYVLAFERFRMVARDAASASADHAAYTAQLTQLQNAMDEAWARVMSDLRAVRKKLGEDVKGKPPEGMFDEKKKRARKEPIGPPRG